MLEECQVQPLEQRTTLAIRFQHTEASTDSGGTRFSVRWFAFIVRIRRSNRELNKTQGVEMQNQRDSRFRSSPTVWMASILVVVYLVLGIAGGDLLSLNYDFAYPLVQVNEAVWHGAVWMLFTSMFLHANPFHLFGNVIFLLIFGTSLEEQVSLRKWLVTYFSSGLMGSVAFLFLGGDADWRGSFRRNLGVAGGCRRSERPCWNGILCWSRHLCWRRVPSPCWRLGRWISAALLLVPESYRARRLVCEPSYTRRH